MPLFEYKGLNREGRNIRGTVDADNSRSAKLKLKKDGVYVVEMKDKAKVERKAKGTGPIKSGAVSVQDLSLMTRQLATLLKANVPLVDSLAAVSEQVENPILSEAVADIKNAVNEGGQLFKAMSRYPKIYDKIYISMVEAGETSGTLDVILIRLAEFTESQSELRSKVRSALMYPVLMLTLTFLILIGLFTFVIPKIVTIFEETPELELPWISKVIINMSYGLMDYWYIMVMGALLIFFAFRSWKNSPAGSVQWDALTLNFPRVGRLNRMVAVSRFSRTLGTLLTGGVPMLTAMGIVRNVVNNEVLGRAIDDARNNISEGESIASPLRKSGQFPPLVIHMINIGEKTGELEKMLTQVSDAYDFQVENEVEGLTSLMGPVMIVFMGLVVGIIVFAIMMPIMNLQQLGGA